jgi:hypothetical protein
MTLNQVISRIRAISLAHKQVRNFYQGLVSDFLTDKTTLYPSLFLQDNGGKISPGSHSTTFSFKMYLLDLVNVSEDSKTNEQDVQSDMVSVAEDVLAQMNNPNYNDWVISIDNNLQLLVENDNDLLSGCVVDFSVRVMYPQNVCQVPTELTDYTTIDNDMKTVYDKEYIATGAEGSTLSIPEIVGKRILFIVREGNPLHKVSNNPDTVEYVWNDTVITLGLLTIAGQRFLIIYRNY